MADQVEPTSALEIITPGQAKIWLETLNKDNYRKMKPTVVRRYARSMKNGLWTLSNDAITFNGNGGLLNGQHRLAACVEAGVPFQAFVAHGVPSISADSMDTGLRRSFADLLSHHGETGAVVLASAIRMDWRWQEGHVFSSEGFGTFSFAEGLRWYQHNPSIRACVSPAQLVRQRFRAPIPPVAALVHRLRLIDKAEADAFFGSLIRGEGLKEGDAILALRNWLQNYFTGRGNARPTSEFYLAILIKAWNAYITGREIKQLSFKRGGLNKEELPQLLDTNEKPYKFVNERTEPVELPVKFKGDKIFVDPTDDEIED